MAAGYEDVIWCGQVITVHLSTFEWSTLIVSFPTRYGRPDPLLQRGCDMRVSLQMASVQYVHTQRFQAEVVSFIQHFTQLQDVLGRQRAAIQGQTVCFIAFLSACGRCLPSETRGPSEGYRRLLCNLRGLFAIALLFSLPWAAKD